jgi:hypothetical protein
MTGISLNISGSFELVESMGEFKPMSWSTVPADDILVRHDLLNSMPVDNDICAQEEIASLEIRKPLDQLGDDLQIVITPSNQKLEIQQIYQQITENVVPIFIYVIDQDQLSDHDIDELRLFRRFVADEPILFIRLDPTNT